MNRVAHQGIWIESDALLTDTLQWPIPLRLLRSIVDGEALNLGAVSPLLGSNLENLRDIYAAWTHGHNIPLAFELSSEAPVAAGGVSLFFSCGVDSFYSLIKHRDEIDNLVLVHGFDVPLAHPDTFAKIEAQARDVASLFGKRLIVARTNMHFEQPEVPGGWEMYCGAGIAAVAYALAPNHGKTYIASSYSYADLFPCGSHPLLDPLWSTEAVKIVHDGGENRMDKLRVIVQYPEAMNRLRVCWENPGEYNCGHCEKCLRTMLGLRALGVEDCAAFPNTLTPELVRRQVLGPLSVMYWRELLNTGLPPDLHAAVRSAIHSYNTGLPPRSGKVKRTINRWRFAARHAATALISPFDRF
ncbi:MAG: hypothetical protein ABR956_04310 [Terracidiphilus sp.]